MVDKVYADQKNVAEKSPTLLSMYVEHHSHIHELYVERTPAGATTFDCARCDYFKQVPRTVSDDELVLMQYAIIGYLRNHGPDDI